MRIGMVCDFFHPRLGGVEMHIWSLSQSLVSLGHDVVVLTHSYKRGSRKFVGVRYFVGGVKVYYMPLKCMVDDDIWPMFCGSTFSLLRWICVREALDVIHVHQATSVLANEALVYANEIDLPCVYTDHSLFGINDDVASVILNRILTITLSSGSCNGIICVSHACRDNLILRTHVDPSIVHAIPNAISAHKYQPDPARRPTDDRLNVIVLSRLVYRKGVDLLLTIVPRICGQYDKVHFIIGGDGPKRLALEEMVESNNLQDRVEFLGAVSSKDVPLVLQRGHLFLNCSLTESFCMAILEAAACGLYVVSTNVGGIPEVLPPDPYISLATATTTDLYDKLSIVIQHYPTASKFHLHRTNPHLIHDRVKKFYSWNRIAQKTIQVYETSIIHQNQTKLNFLQRLQRYATIPNQQQHDNNNIFYYYFTSIFLCFLYTVFHLYAKMIMLYWQPIHLIDVLPLTQSSSKTIPTPTNYTNNDSNRKKEENVQPQNT